MEFVGLVTRGNFDEATKMVIRNSDHDQMIVVDKRDLQWEFTQTLVSSPRTFSEFAAGRQHFSIGERPYEFVVQHGRIVNQGRTLADGRFKQAEFLPLSEAAQTDPFKVPNQIQEMR